MNWRVCVSVRACVRVCVLGDRIDVSGLAFVCAHLLSAYLSFLQINQAQIFTVNPEHC